MSMAAPAGGLESIRLEDYPDERLLQILRDAEQRLKAKEKEKASALVLADASEPSLSSAAIRLSTGASEALKPYTTTSENGATRIEPSCLVSHEHKKLANGYRTIDDRLFVPIKKDAKKKADAGDDWFNMPRTDLTPELKRDLQLLKMRDVLDPKRFYKKDNRKSAFPEFAQVGTIIPGPTEHFSRISKKEQKKSLAQQVLEGEKNSQRFKTKYAEIQRAKTSGKKDHYKALKAKRKSKG